MWPGARSPCAPPNSILDWDHFREDARIHDSDSPIEYCHFTDMDFKLPDLMDMGDVRSLFSDNLEKCAIAVY